MLVAWPLGHCGASMQNWSDPRQAAQWTSQLFGFVDFELQPFTATRFHIFAALTISSSMLRYPALAVRATVRVQFLSQLTQKMNFI